VTDTANSLKASEALAAILRSVYASALADHCALYCSLPISSGRRYQQWIMSLPTGVGDVDHAASLYPTAHEKHVIRPNIDHAKKVVEKLRRLTTRPVIDPSAVPGIKGWLQSDWIAFWESVIGRFAVAVVLVEDWQFSFGCTREFLHALRNGIPAFAENGRLLTASRGAALIGQAVAEIERLTGSAHGLLSTLVEIEKLGPKGPPTALSLNAFL
jgi:hypothetical protein